MDDPRQPTEPVHHRPETVLVPLPPPAPPSYGLHGGPAAPPKRAQRAVLWAVLAGVVVVALAVTGVVVLTGRSTGLVLPPPTAVPGTSTAAPVAPSADRTTLDEQVRTDAAKIDPLLDRWVPQLYAEQAGTDAAAQEVLRRYRAAVAAYPGALLLSSTDYASFELDGYYVVVMPTAYATAVEANAWCTTQALAASACYAKRVSRTAGPAGSTVYR